MVAPPADPRPWALSRAIRPAIICLDFRSYDLLSDHRLANLHGVNLGEPVLDLAPGVRGALLQALARLEQPVTRRALAAIAGVAPGHASAVVEQLIETGLVAETAAGRSSMVALNRSHLAAGPLLTLAGLRGELIRRLRVELARWPDLRGAWLFGSVARGQSTGESDVDVLIVADDPQSSELHGRLAQLHADVRSWTGNELQVVEHSPNSWRTLVRTKNPLVEQIRLDGIALTLEPPSLLGRRT
jgi:predicted nucleotidyltransferase